MRTFVAELSHAGAMQVNFTVPTKLLLLASALTTLADEFAEKSREAKMQLKLWNPVPLKIQSLGDPDNFGKTPLETETVTKDFPTAEIELPVSTLTDAQSGRP
jgi:hypothetical protein